MNVKNFIRKIQESESFKKFKDELDEISATGMVAGYDSPKAFAPSDEEGKESFDKKTRSNAEQFGYSIVKKQSKRNTVSESSTTGGMGVFSTSENFVDYGFEEDDDLKFEDNDEQKPHPTMMKTIESSGYRAVYSKGQRDSAYKQAMKSLHETSYKSYKGDKTRTTNEKINYSIKELNQALMQIERVVNHATRLKTEMAVDQRSLWRSSHNRLVKIGEKLNRIGKKINELGA